MAMSVPLHESAMSLLLHVPAQLLRGTHTKTGTSITIL
jgi:hypothetical protein